MLKKKKLYFWCGFEQCALSSWCGKTQIARIEADMRAAIVSEWNLGGRPDMIRRAPKVDLSWIQAFAYCTMPQALSFYTICDVLIILRSITIAQGLRNYDIAWHCIQCEYRWWLWIMWSCKVYYVWRLPSDEWPPVI